MFGPDIFLPSFFSEVGREKRKKSEKRRWRRSKKMLTSLYSSRGGLDTFLCLDLFFIWILVSRRFSVENSDKSILCNSSRLSGFLGKSEHSKLIPEVQILCTKFSSRWLVRRELRKSLSKAFARRRENFRRYCRIPESGPSTFSAHH